MVRARHLAGQKRCLAFFTDHCVISDLSRKPELRPTTRPQTRQTRVSDIVLVAVLEVTYKDGGTKATLRELEMKSPMPSLIASDRRCPV